MAAPRFLSEAPAGTDITAPELGAMMLGLPLFEQGRHVARVLEARRGGEAAFKQVTVQLPRRATKTTSIWATILGRAATREGYRCVVTAQRGTVASRILLEHGEMLLRNGEAVESREARGDTSRPVLFRSGGREHIDFPNGSRIWVVPPEAGAVRSAAADDVVIDEAGEFEGDKGRDFLLGVLPLMDTKGPLAQLIIAGTPGKLRSGMFWESLEEARAGADDELGIVDYSASDADDPEDRAVWERVHPGPSSLLPDGRALTPMRVLERRYEKLGPVGFAREYLCLWPLDASVSAIDMAAWDEHTVPMEGLPERFGLAYDVAPDGSSAALCAAWRDEDGVARLGVVAYEMGVSWLAQRAHAVAKKHRVPVRYDGIGANHGPAQEIERLRGVTTTVGYAKDAMAAAQLLVSSLADGKLAPFDQVSLRAAADGAAWRQTEGGRLFARKASAGDVTPLVAASLALLQFDQMPARQPQRIVTSRRI
ncbi:hypothetical protein M2316_002817 [Cellulosimicrobium cellulans]|nr:hypothetical protein [Cellulosimicrobium cellulans]